MRMLATDPKFAALMWESRTLAVVVGMYMDARKDYVAVRYAGREKGDAEAFHAHQMRLAHAHLVYTTTKAALRTADQKYRAALAAVKFTL
mgnify:CR=1 FL=1